MSNSPNLGSYPKGKVVPLTFHLRLSDLRRVADEMMDGVFFVTDVWRVVDFRDNEPGPCNGWKGPVERQAPIGPTKAGLALGGAGLAL